MPERYSKETTAIGVACAGLVNTPALELARRQPRDREHPHPGDNFGDHCSAGQEGARQEDPGEEERRQEGACQEGPGEEDRRQEGAAKKAPAKKAPAKRTTAKKATNAVTAPISQVEEIAEKVADKVAKRLDDTFASRVADQVSKQVSRRISKTLELNPLDGLLGKSKKKSKKKKK